MSADPRSFDHAALAAYPEYHTARQALDALGQALGQAADEMTRAAFVEAAADMARTSYAADWCECCRREVDPRCWPHAANVDDSGWLRGTYRCPRTGAVWQCGYASPEVIGRMT